MNQQPELKPCPFCGGKAVLYEHVGYQVMCSKCDVRGHLWETRPPEQNKEMAIEKWNIRTPVHKWTAEPSETPETDARYLAVKQRFEQCSDEELQRIIDRKELLCLDTYNYDEKHHTFCPIAIAMSLDDQYSPTDSKTKELIAQRFQPTNILKGIKGEFYTTNRRWDILLLCKTILERRTLEKQRDAARAEVERLKKYQLLCDNLEAEGRPHGSDWQHNPCECDHCAMWDKFVKQLKEIDSK